MKRKALLEVLNTLMLEDLKYLCEKMELKKTGNKRELIERIMKEVRRVDLGFLRGLLKEALAPYNRNTLLKLSKKLGLEIKKTAKESEIIGTILDFVIEGVEPGKKKTIPKEVLKKLANELLKADLELKPRDEKEFKKMLVNRLKPKRKLKILTEAPQKSLDLKEIGLSVSIADLLVEYENYQIPVELKYTKGRNVSEVLKGLGQCLVYRKIYGGAILLIYDSSKAFSDKPIAHEFEKGIWVVIR